MRIPLVILWMALWVGRMSGYRTGKVEGKASAGLFHEWKVHAGHAQSIDNYKIEDQKLNITPTRESPIKSCNYT